MYLTNTVPEDNRPAADWQQRLVEYAIDVGEIIFPPCSDLDAFGKPMTFSDDEWTFNMGPSTETSTWSVESPLLRFTIECFAFKRTTKTSPHAGYTVAMRLPTLLQKAESYRSLATASTLEEYRSTLTRVSDELLTLLRQSKRLHEFWLVKAWYLWGTTRRVDLGFDLQLARRLQLTKIPGNPKGDAVRSGDPLRGPLDPELELPLLRTALAADEPKNRIELQQNLAVSLSLAYGCNPTAFRALTEDDLILDPSYLVASTHASSHIRDIVGPTLMIPAVKKRRPIREVFRPVPVPPYLVSKILALITQNRVIPTEGSHAKGSAKPQAPLLRPIFMNDFPREKIQNSADSAFAFTMAQRDFRRLLDGFVTRHNLFSPLTNQPLHLTFRRLRYTFATELADSGASLEELAFLLGHSDLQNVRVYYGIGPRLVNHLAAAAGEALAELVSLFRPAPLAADLQRPIPRTPPSPIGCYLCPLFTPSEAADHSRVLRHLMKLQATRTGRGAFTPSWLPAAIKAIGDIC